MNGSRAAVVLTVLAGLTANAAVGLADGGSVKATRLDSSRLHQLVQIVHSDADEQRRKAAVIELGKADPKLNTEVIQAVTHALLKDPSAAVRLTAVEVITRYRSVFTVAGLALESAVESDPSQIVRTAARQALWEYHLIGYKSVKWGDGFLPQTAEPPIARPARARTPVTAEPPVVTVAAQAPAPAVAQLPAVTPAPGPRVAPLPAGPLTLISPVPPHANLTVEPPLAAPFSRPTYGPLVHEPPMKPHYPEPTSVGTPHPFAADLPLIVPPPGPLSGATPLANPTVEPPFTKSQRK